MSDFFDSHEGNARSNAPSLKAILKDALFDMRLSLDSLRGRRLSPDTPLPKQKVLLVAVEVPTRKLELAAVLQKLCNSRHAITVSVAEMMPQGKYDNINRAIQRIGRIDEFDWLVIVDDDVAFGRCFLDRYLEIASAADLTISQPAHRFRSYTTYQVTRRRFGARWRRTGFVEIGPLTVVHQKAFTDLLPFPPSRYSYGIDVLWADVARRKGWRLGVVDALPIGHLRPVAGSYDMEEARQEGRALLARFDVRLSRAEMMTDL